MKIAIDARWIFPKISGIGAYTRELIRQVCVRDEANSYRILFNEPDVMERTIAETGMSAAAHVKPVLIDYGVFSPQSQFRLPRLLRRMAVDVYHSPNYMIPLRAFPRHRCGPTRCVVTIHDVIPLLFPDHAPRSRKSRLFFIYRWLMRQIGARADAIITVSHTSREDTIRELRIAPRQQAMVRAIYNGVSGVFRPPADARAPGPSSARALLYVGRSDPYKNLEGLVRAFALVRERCSFPVHLSIAGAEDPRYPEAPRLARELGVANDVTWTGYLSDKDLVQTYQEADLLVHPSRYEGFGLQILEAMACGTPVICGNRGSLPEVAGDAALLVDPDNHAAMAAAIVRVLNEPELASELSRKGMARAAAFTWERTARETIALYAEVGSIKR